MQHRAANGRPYRATNAAPAQWSAERVIELSFHNWRKPVVGIYSTGRLRNLNGSWGAPSASIAKKLPIVLSVIIVLE
jgi:hypothetical protein